MADTDTKEVEVQEPKEPVNKEEAKETPAAATSSRAGRVRKQVERMVAGPDVKEAVEFTVPEGSGTALREIPNVGFNIDRTKSDELQELYKICFGRVGKKLTRKTHLRQFCGYAEDKDLDVVKDKYLNKTTIAGLKKLLTICDQDVGGTKGDLSERLLEFLQKPGESGRKSIAEKNEEKKAAAVKKKARLDRKREIREEKRARSAKKKAAKAKALEKKRKKQAVVEESSDDSDESDGSESESEEKPKPKKKAKAKAKPTKKRKTTPKKAAKPESSDDEDDDMPIGSLKKKGQIEITKELLSEKIKEIADEGIDPDSLTLKLIRQKLSEKFGGQDMSEHKGLIKELVTEGDLF